MNVAFLTHEPFYPPTGGGSAEAAYLVQEMVRRGHEVDIYCPKMDNTQEVETRFGVRAHEFETWAMGRYTSFRNFKYLAYPLFLERLVIREARGFDLALSQHAISAVTAGRLKRRLGMPVVMNFLDCLSGFMETWPAYVAPPPMVRALRKYELTLPKRYVADAVLTVSDTLADSFIETGFPQERVTPIYYGYDSALFPFESEPSEQASEPPTVVMHGSFDRHHLGPIAMTGLLEALRGRPDLRIKMVGRHTPALLSFAKGLKAAAPSVDLELKGFAPYHMMADVLQGARLGIIPYEASTGTHCAFVAKVVELLALGIPVVSTSLQGIERYFHNESLVDFTGFDGCAFGQGILKRLAKPPTTDQRAAAAVRVKKELDWRSISRKAVDRIEEVYESRGLG